MPAPMTGGSPCRAGAAFPAVAAAAVLLAAGSAAAQPVVALLPVRSSDGALAAAADAALREALIGGGYLVVSGPPVASALAQTGLTEITSVEEGRRVGQVLGAGVIVGAGLEPTWLSVRIMTLEDGSVEVREGELPPERVELPATLVANLGAAIDALIEAGVPLLPIAVPDGPTEPPPVEPPPVEPPPVEPPPVEPPPDEPTPVFYEEGPLHVRVFPALAVLLGTPAGPGASPVGGRVGAGIAYAPIPELDIGLELDIHFGLGTALDVLAALTYRFPIAPSVGLDIAPHLALGYFQMLTGAESPLFMVRGSADLILSLVPGYALYFTPASFSLFAGDVVGGVYELGIGFLGSF
jgi:hypothetical protein